MQMLPLSARLAGYFGLIPFAALAVTTLVASPSQSEMASHALVAYAAIIATFVGAIHWGLAAAQQDGSANWQYLWSVVPSLLAWLCLFLQPPPALIAIAVLLVVCLVIDIGAKSAGSFPPAMMQLRYRLTAIAVASLVLAAAFGKEIS